MTAVALDQERHLAAERLLARIEQRHGLPHLRQSPHAVHLQRFLVAYLPETADGRPAPSALEVAFAATMFEALQLLPRMIGESRGGYGSAVYIHDLDTAVADQAA